MIQILIFSVLLKCSLLKKWEDHQLYLETLDWLYKTKPEPWSEN